MKERLLSIEISGDSSAGAALYLAALAYPEKPKEFNLFLEAVTQYAGGKRLDRTLVRSIDRTARVIYELRYPAAVVANIVSQRVVADEVANFGMCFSGDPTVRNVAEVCMSGFPKHRTLPNFFAHVWNPSKPTLHLGIAFKLHALSGYHVPPPLIPLVANPAWVSSAVKNAQFHAAMLGKCIDDLGELVAINPNSVCKTAVLVTQNMPDAMYRTSEKGQRRQREGNAAWQALKDD